MRGPTIRKRVRRRATLMIVPQLDESDPKRNRLLAEMKPDDYVAVMASANVVSMKFRSRINRQGQPVNHVYFPLSCMVSMLVTTKDKAQLEMATVGREGVVGAAGLLLEHGAPSLDLIQIPGMAVRIPADTFRGHLRSRPSVDALMNKHLYALMRQILQGAVCNRLHSMEEGCARWLLMTHDRAGEDTFPLTQEFLSHMLGVRRATVNVATGMLKKAGFIRYVRGYITVIDRPGLESASCECYQTIVEIYDSIILDGHRG